MAKPKKDPIERLFRTVYRNHGLKVERRPGVVHAGWIYRIKDFNGGEIRFGERALRRLTLWFISRNLKG